MATHSRRSTIRASTGSTMRFCLFASIYRNAHWQGMACPTHLSRLSARLFERGSPNLTDGAGTQCHGACSFFVSEAVAEDHFQYQVISPVRRPDAHAEVEYKIGRQGQIEVRQELLLLLPD